MLEAQFCGFAVSFGTTAQTFSDAGPVKKFSVFHGLGCIKATVLHSISVLALSYQEGRGFKFFLAVSRRSIWALWCSLLYLRWHLLI